MLRHTVHACVPEDECVCKGWGVWGKGFLLGLNNIEDSQGKFKPPQYQSSGCTEASLDIHRQNTGLPCLVVLMAWHL